MIHSLFFFNSLSFLSLFPDSLSSISCSLLSSSPLILSFSFTLSPFPSYSLSLSLYLSLSFSPLYYSSSSYTLSSLILWSSHAYFLSLPLYHCLLYFHFLTPTLFLFLSLLGRTSSLFFVFCFSSYIFTSFDFNHHNQNDSQNEDFILLGNC